MESRGPFISVRDVTLIFSSSKRPSADTVKEAINSLPKDKLDEVIQIQKSTIFKKEKPDVIQEANLEVYAVEKEVYKAQFWKTPVEEKRGVDKGYPRMSRWRHYTSADVPANCRGGF